MASRRGIVLDVLLAVGVVAAVGYAVLQRLPRTERVERSRWQELQAGSPLDVRRTTGPVLVEFVDYQCPFCARAEVEVFDALRDSLPGLRRIVRHFPLPNHPHAMTAAAAVECAGAQTGSIAPMHTLLYRMQDSIGHLPWTTLARRAGVRDTAAFVACLDDPQVRARIDADRRLGELLAVNGTPTFYLEREQVPGGSPAHLRAYFLANARR